MLQNYLKIDASQYLFVLRLFCVTRFAFRHLYMKPKLIRTFQQNFKETQIIHHYVNNSFNFPSSSNFYVLKNYKNNNVFSMGTKTKSKSEK